MTVQDFIYKGNVRIISIPKRELSPASIYPELIGRIGRVIRMSGNKVGIIIEYFENGFKICNCTYTLDRVEK